MRCFVITRSLVCILLLRSPIALSLSKKYFLIIRDYPQISLKPQLSIKEAYRVLNNTWYYFFTEFIDKWKIKELNHP